MSRKLWEAAPAPSTPFGRYRVLSPLAGVRVSPLCLGGGSIGDKWDKIGLGNMTKDMSFKLLDAFYEAGGNFIDTACNYHDETSEKFIGEWMESRGNRDQMVIATKYTSSWKVYDPAIKIQMNYVGTNMKNMHLSVQQSLQKLRTDYIDILYIHWWDWDTNIEELINGLHHLVAQGKVLYLGASDTPAWVVSQANQYAKDHGKTPFSVYQGQWNIMSRSFEHDIIPMARKLGLALAPWDVMAGGKLRSNAEEERRRETGENGRHLAFFPGDNGWKRNEAERKMADALEKVAKEVGTEHTTAVAIAYVMHKTTHVFPIVGGRKVEHLMANIEALKISLSEDQIKYLESIIPFDAGFPANIIGDGTNYTKSILSAGTSEKWPLPRPILPSDS